MKILFYNHQGKISGAERILLLILKRLDRSAFEPVMVCPETGAMAAESRKLGVRFEAVEQLEARFTLRPDKLLFYFASFVKIIRALRAAIARQQPDLIHAVSTRSGLAATMASVGMKIPVVWHLHDELPRHPLSTLIRVFAACFSRIRLMPVSEATGKSFRGRFLQTFGRHLPEQVVHNGIELDEFKFDSSNRPRIRRELGLSKYEIVFGIVGQITPRKGQWELLRTFAETQKSLPSKLLIVGAPVFNQDEIYLDEIKQRVKELGIEEKVKFLGARPDVSAVMQAMDALIINSRSEALVLVALEALACRTPVIATDVGGTREIIEHRETGWLVPYGDEDALAKALVALGNDEGLRRKFAAEGEKIAASRLDAGHFVSRIEEFYKQCATREKLAVSKDLATQS